MKQLCLWLSHDGIGFNASPVAVEDGTGVGGLYNVGFDLISLPRRGSVSPDEYWDEYAAAVRDALKSEYGLQLVKAKVQLPAFVVDSVGMPTAN